MHNTLLGTQLSSVRSGALRAFLELVLKDFPCRTGGKTVKHDDLARPLVGRELRICERFELARCKSASRDKLDESDDFLIRFHDPANDCGLEHGRMRIEDRLHFSGIGR